MCTTAHPPYKRRTTAACAPRVHRTRATRTLSAPGVARRTRRCGRVEPRPHRRRRAARCQPGGRRGEYAARRGALCARLVGRHRRKRGGRRRQRLILANAGAASTRPEQPAESAQLARGHGPRCRARDHGGGRRRRRDTPRRLGPVTPPRPLATPGHTHGRHAPQTCIFDVSLIAPRLPLRRGVGAPPSAAAALHTYFYRRTCIALSFVSLFPGEYKHRIYGCLKTHVTTYAARRCPLSPPRAKSARCGQVDKRSTSVRSSHGSRE